MRLMEGVQVGWVNRTLGATSDKVDWHLTVSKREWWAWWLVFWLFERKKEARSLGFSDG